MISPSVAVLARTNLAVGIDEPIAMRSSSGPTAYRTPTKKYAIRRAITVDTKGV
jgi:hypothetical protein